MAKHHENNFAALDVPNPCPNMPKYAHEQSPNQWLSCVARNPDFYKKIPENRYIPVPFEWWAWQGLNLRPLRCQRRTSILNPQKSVVFEIAKHHNVGRLTEVLANFTAHLPRAKFGGFAGHLTSRNCFTENQRKTAERAATHIDGRFLISAVVTLYLSRVTASSTELSGAAGGGA